MTAPGPVLRDIHLPSEPSWWPPAPGWWLLAALALLALAWTLRGLAGRRRLRRARRALHEEFERARAEHPDGAAQVAALSLLLRRIAKKHAPAALALRDRDWLCFLDAEDPERPFSAGPGRLLLDGPYRPHIGKHEADALAAAVRRRLDAFVAPPRAARKHSPGAA